MERKMVKHSRRPPLLQNKRRCGKGRGRVSYRRKEGVKTLRPKGVGQGLKDTEPPDRRGGKPHYQLGYGEKGTQTEKRRRVIKKTGILLHREKD